MARMNPAFLAFNRGLVSPKALARVDLDRTKLSAETFTNWIARSQGSMRLRPGTKWQGSSLNDTGAEFIEFVASTDDVALPELTPQKMRIWLPSDTGNVWETPAQPGAFVPLARPKVDTTLTLSDTGWANTSTGGANGNQVSVSAGTLTLNATSIGALARREKRVIVSDTGTEHSLAITVQTGPVTLRVGSIQRGDDYISETSIGTGRHNLAFIPTGNFWVTLQHDKLVARLVSSLTIGDSGTVELTSPWTAAHLDDIRYDQSADVVYVDCAGVLQRKIERRGTGRSWSLVEYAPDNGPFKSGASSSAKLLPAARYGNTTLASNIPFFKSTHVGALFRLFTNGQTGLWPLGAAEANTEAVKVTGVGDTGTSNVNNERRVTITVTGTYTGSMAIQRSFDGEDLGFHLASTDFMGGQTAEDTGTFGRTIDDGDDNISVWYRVRMTGYTSGVAFVTITYNGGGTHGIARVTNFNSNTSVNIEVVKRFSDISASTDSWQEGFWSDAQGFPSAVALHDGRLGHAGDSNLFLSESDNYESFDGEVEGDAGPIVRTLGSGPVDNINFMVSLLRLILGTAGAELSARSSSLDEPLTPSNNGVKAFSTQGSANIRALKIDSRAVHVQRSNQRVFMIGFGTGADALGDYESTELTDLVPDLLTAGVVSVAVQRHPDTRIHFVLANGKVAIFTFKPQQEVAAWTMWETRSGDTVEKAFVLPSLGEDRVFYHVRRSINGSTKRYLERWAGESESEGDSGLSWLADCAKYYTDTGRATALTGFSHLNGEATIVWADDTGQSHPGVDLSYDTGGVQRTYTPAAGTVTLTQSAHHAVVGLPYEATWKSTKLAYAAQAGTALAQMKRTDKIAFCLYKTHCRGLRFGNDTGNLDPLPRIIKGSVVDSRTIFQTFDEAAFPFPGLWSTDSRIVLKAIAPRPCTVLAAVPTVQTNEKV